ncbi:flagellar assembly peptidoglycan hydrolase FlgJ [Pararobbsia silviterrae]|uniref:Peptidoglycan hydrolase FlgJ n=2 Tax=Pararobbsia silviterrae TaxID=1792498 RepID=A0A494X3W3_9BURK|nr:flagellar assembly peptidoglycan hydrolase FlgJ [Pararobbsia silviterrae]
MQNTLGGSTDAADISNRFALDTNGFAAMRTQVQNSPLAGAKLAARQFDATFIQMMLKSMQDATPSKGLLDSEAGNQYMSMLDQQLAQQLSTRGIGVADALLGQLLRNQGMQVGPDGQLMSNDANGTTSASGAINTNAMLNMLAQSAYASAHAQGQSLAQNGQDFNADDSDVGYDGDDRKQAFVNKLGSAARTASAASGIPARFILSHAALESGWGRHEIREADGSTSHNVFGIKAGKNWTGRTVMAMTTEYVDGVAQKVRAKFRAYDSYDDAMVDYANLLRSNPRYADTVASSHDAVGFANGLQRAGYATDPAYAKKLVRIMNQMV